MLKRIFVMVLGVLTVAHPLLYAQEVSGYPVGFCNGEMNTRSDIKFSGKGSVVSAAIHIPPAYAATVGDNNLESINVALASKLNLKWLKVWVRRQLDGPDLASATLEKGDFAQGWNNVRLDEPYAIPAEPGEGFYMGYSYEQTNKAGAISSLGTPHVGALWTKQDDGEWTDMSADGTLCVEGLVFGDNLPRFNLCLMSVSTDPYFIVSEGALNCYAKVRNLATVNATSFEIEADIEGADSPCRAKVECNLALGEYETYKFTVYPEFPEGFKDVADASFAVTAVNGMEDEDPEDNRGDASFNILAKAFKRVVLAEEFTTENCPNCPAVTKFLHNVLQNPEFGENLEVVCHHEGYYSDWLTTDFDAAYTWFYNAGGSMYAPAAMLDRARFQDTETPVFFPESQEFFENAVSDRLLIPAMVSVEPSVSLVDNDTRISVSVEGERVSGSIYDDCRITVFVVEDNIKARSQAGAGGVYIHDHVNRAVNDTWGVPVDWNGNFYSYSCDFDLSPEWDLSNLKVVAFLSNYDSGNPNNCEVANTGVCSSFTSGVTEVADGQSARICKILSADGVERRSLAPGLNIVVRSDGTSGKIMK